MARGPVIPSAVDLTDAGNVVQARHELHRAIDSASMEQRAAWAEKWGEAALEAGEKAALDAGYFDGLSAPSGVFRAEEIAESLNTILGQDQPDLELARRRAGELKRKIRAVIEAFEE